MEKRNMTTLKKTLSIEEMDALAVKVTMEYVKSSNEFARTYFCDKYGLTSSAFYKLLEYAVVIGLVEEKVIDKMEEKAITNSKLHAEGAGAATKIKYAKLRMQRIENFLESLEKEEIKEMAEFFAETIEATKGDAAACYQVSLREFDFVLRKAIVDGIVDDDIVDKIEERSIKNYSGGNPKFVKHFFENLRQERAKTQN